MDRRIKSGDDTVQTIGAARAASAGLTILQRAGAFCVDPEQPPAIFMISKPQRGLLSTAVRVH
jgi:hypothetical protein